MTIDDYLGKSMDIDDYLDRARFGDSITVVMANRDGSQYAKIEGPALVHQPAVGIDLLDGDPHIIRNHQSKICGDIAVLQIHRDGEVIGTQTFTKS